jgi:phosphatidylserine/phosphatidylglycerophosphate/cardiolipin synthase-like enzyme
VPPQAGALHGTREWWGWGAEAPRLALQARDGFDTAWQRAKAPPDAWLAMPRASPGDVGAPSPQVAPLTVRVARRSLQLVLGGLPVAMALVSLIGATRRRALVTAPYIHPRAAGVRRLVAALRPAVSRGVDTRLLLGARPEPADLAWLRAAGMPVRWMDATVSTRGHAKGLIADDVAVITSANWSSAGCGPNWEAALVARSAGAAEYYAAVWHRDWEAAVPLATRVWGVRSTDMLPAWSPRTSDP